MRRSGRGRWAPRPLVSALLLALLATAPLRAEDAAAASGGGPRKDLQDDSMRRDIAGASYYELLAWCKELGLPDSGDRKALQERLLKHFGVAAAPAAATEEPRVEIVSARDIRYYTVKETEERYVELRGGVVVVVTDRKRDATHRVEAEYLLYNQTTGEMTASGGARYVLTKGQKEEVFSGESLSFDTDSLEGVFYAGSVERERTVDGKAMEFLFQGDSMSRLSNGTVIIENGSMTSSEPVDPYYLVKARKAWLLASGEWAALGTTLEVGRVPVLYLPFFFYPGDQLLFHPSLEYRSREGTVLQTTTYLIGQRKQESDPLSLLQLNEEPGAGYQRVQRGMFLTVDPDNREEVKDVTTYLTLMADYYSRLGGMVGLEAAFPQEFSGKIGIGVSRSIFLDGGVYTPYYDDPEKGYISVWNKSVVAGVTLPIRFGVDSDFLLLGRVLSAKGSIEAYSDPFFPSDFYNRSTGLNWDKLLGGASSTTAAQASKTSLAWTAGATANLGSSLKPYLGTETATASAEVGAFIGSRAVEPGNDVTKAADPARSFYYPSSLTAPTLKLQLRGTALSLSTAPKSPTKEEAAPESGEVKGAPAIRENPGKGIRAPWEEQARTAEEAQTEGGRLDEALVLPSTRADIGVIDKKSVSSLQLTYTASPQMVVSLPFASADWKAPEEVDYATSYSLMTAQSGAGVGLRGVLLDGLASLSIDLAASANLRTRGEGTAEIAPELWQSYLLDDYKATKLLLTEKTAASVQPLLGVASLRGSSLTYNLGWQFLATTYDSLVDGKPVYVTTAGDFDADTVTVHSVAASLVYKPRDTQQSLTVTAVLPPESISVNGQAKLTLWKLSSTIGLAVSKPEETWVRDLNVTGVFTPLDWLSLTQAVKIDADAWLLSELSTTLRLDGFSTVFAAKRMFPVDPHGTKTGDEEVFLPSGLTFQYSLPTQKLWFWKNRISLEGNVATSWNTDLQAFTNSKLTFSLSLSVNIYKFLTLKFTEQSYNNRMYQYIPAYADGLGFDWVNPFTDLLRSFNFANTADRYLSGFKVRKVGLTIVHEMKDWTLQMEYAGAPALTTLPDDSKRFEWQRTFSVLLQWKPLKLIKAKMGADSSGVTYGE